MFLISWNVAGWSSSSASIREVFGSLGEFFAATQADVVCLQECKGTAAKLQNSPLDMGAKDPERPSVTGKKRDRDGNALPSLRRLQDDWESFWSLSDKQYRGFNGVVTFARKGLVHRAESRPFGVEELDGEGRVVVTHLSAVVVINVYVPNARGGARSDFKARFLSELLKLRARLRSETRLPVMIVGDLNMTYRAADATWQLQRLHLGRLATAYELSDDESREEAVRRTSPLGRCVPKDVISRVTHLVANALCARLIEQQHEEAQSQERRPASSSITVDAPTDGATPMMPETAEADRQLLSRIVAATPAKDLKFSHYMYRYDAPPVPLRDFVAAGYGSIHAADLTRSYPAQHNRDLYSVATCYGLPPHGDESSVFLASLLGRRPEVSMEAPAEMSATNSDTRDTVKMYDTFLLPTRQTGEPGVLFEEPPYCPCPYTCWDQSSNKRLSNEGTRLDYILVDEELRGHVQPRTATDNNTGGSSPSTEDDFFSELDGSCRTDSIRRAMAGGAYPAAAFDGSGMPPLTSEAARRMFRGLPSTGLFVTPPQLSDHIGVCVVFRETFSVSKRLGQVRDPHRCMYRPPATIQSFFRKKDTTVTAGETSSNLQTQTSATETPPSHGVTLAQEKEVITID